MAAYAAAFPVGGEARVGTARRYLIAALAGAFEALRDPECAALIGPVVPGALMPGGARVPGTSLELEPAQAAFCIGLMLGAAPEAEHRVEPRGPRLADALGALLAGADYQSRKAAMEGKAPPAVRDLLAAMLKALEIQSVLAAARGPRQRQGHESLRDTRVAVSAVVTAQLGGTPAQIIRAISHACIDGDLHGDGEETQGVLPGRGWATAETISRGVRHACQAIAPGRPSSLLPGEMTFVAFAGRALGAAPAGGEPFGTVYIDRLAGRPEPQTLAQLMTRFQAAADRCFPARQAQRIKVLFAAPERLDDLPVNEFLAALVTNGAR